MEQLLQNSSEIATWWHLPLTVYHFANHVATRTVVIRGNSNFVHLKVLVSVSRIPEKNLQRIASRQNTGFSEKEVVPLFQP